MRKKYLEQICKIFGLDLDGDFIYLSNPRSDDKSAKLFYINAMRGVIEEVNNR